MVAGGGPRSPSARSATVVAALVYLSVVNATNAPQVIDSVSGATFVGTFDGTAEAFKGIRYGNVARRFAIAEQATYAVGEQYNATAFGPRCFQEEGEDADPRAPPLSEDCLFLNVWRPVGTTSESNLPVAVWIHGGGCSSGSGSDWMYNGTLFAGNQQIVLITINYRLGPLGFLCVDEVCTGGMNSMMDQIVALEWVQEHIASFGGDPDVVTMFGQSAGGQAICELVVSERADGLFHHAVMESGPCIGSFAPANASVGQATGLQWMASVGASSLEDLQNKTKFPMETFKWGSLHAYPCFGDPSGVLSQSPESLYLSGRAHVQTLVMGVTTFDGTGPWMLEGVPLTTRAEYMQQVEQNLAGYTAQQIESIVAMYDPEIKYNGSYAASLIAITGDRDIVCPTIALANLTSRRSESVYLYRFGQLYARDLALEFELLPDNASEVFPEWAPTFASHTAEIPFIFGNTFGPSLHHKTPVNMPFSDGEQRLSKSISSLWSSFMKTGSPSHGGHSRNFPAWPAVNGTGDELEALFLGVDSFVMDANEHAAKCALLWPSGVIDQSSS